MGINLNRKHVYWLGGCVFLGALIIYGIIATNATTVSEKNEYDLTNLKAKYSYSDLYYRAIYLNSTGELVLTMSFAQPNRVVIIPANNLLIDEGYVFTGGIVEALVCCNISMNDRLFTNGGTATLNGTLTNGFDKTITTKQYRFLDGSWQNINVHTGKNPTIYNSIIVSAQGFGGQQVAWAMESKNVSTPTMMRIKLIGN